MFPDLNSLSQLMVLTTCQVVISLMLEILGLSMFNFLFSRMEISITQQLKT
jgi:hypothetical protein